MATKTTMRKILPSKEWREQSQKSRVAAQLNWLHRRLSSVYGLNQSMNEILREYEDIGKVDASEMTDEHRSRLLDIRNSVRKSTLYAQCAVDSIKKFTEFKKAKRSKKP